MREILESLKKTPEVRGVVLLTTDGVVVETVLPDTVDGDAFAALASHLAVEARRATRRGGLNDFRRIVLTATRGTLVLVAMEHAFLMVAVRNTVDLDQITLDVESAAHKVLRQIEIKVD
ncbi:MAG: roadblock/LC7 domain-containing protein [Planctomycetes bacterium]|nr:roadblock/LC7 domain-containing protein [Planctomycetota bacterium]